MIQGGFGVGSGWVRVDSLVSGGFGSIRLVPAFSMNGVYRRFLFFLISNLVLYVIAMNLCLPNIIRMMDLGR